MIHASLFSDEDIYNAFSDTDDKHKGRQPACGSYAKVGSILTLDYEIFLSFFAKVVCLNFQLFKTGQCGRPVDEQTSACFQLGS